MVTLAAQEGPTLQASIRHKSALWCYINFHYSDVVLLCIPQIRLTQGQRST